jgi:hypothetical protein
LAVCIAQKGEILPQAETVMGVGVGLEIAAGFDHAVNEAAGNAAAIVGHVARLVKPCHLTGREGSQFSAMLRKRDAAFSCCDLPKMEGKRATVCIAAATKEGTGRSASGTA